MWTCAVNGLQFVGMAGVSAKGAKGGVFWETLRENVWLSGSETVRKGDRQEGRQAGRQVVR